MWPAPSGEYIYCLFLHREDLVDEEVNRVFRYMFPNSDFQSLIGASYVAVAVTARNYISHWSFIKSVAKRFINRTNTLKKEFHLDII